MNKPPLGLKQKFIADWHRRTEIAQAILRFAETDTVVPDEWIEEFVALNAVRAELDKQRKQQKEVGSE